MSYVNAKQFSNEQETLYLIIDGSGQGVTAYSWFHVYPFNWLKVVPYHKQSLTVVRQGIKFVFFDRPPYQKNVVYEAIINKCLSDVYDAGSSRE